MTLSAIRPLGTRRWIVLAAASALLAGCSTGVASPAGPGGSSPASSSPASAVSSPAPLQAGATVAPDALLQRLRSAAEQVTTMVITAEEEDTVEGTPVRVHSIIALDFTDPGKPRTHVTNTARGGGETYQSEWVTIDGVRYDRDRDTWTRGPDTFGITAADRNQLPITPGMTLTFLGPEVIEGVTLQHYRADHGAAAQPDWPVEFWLDEADRVVRELDAEGDVQTTSYNTPVSISAPDPASIKA